MALAAISPSAAKADPTLPEPLIDALTTSAADLSRLSLSRYLPLELETRAGVDTLCAAFHLNRQPQTLRGWAAFDTGPIKPTRVNGRLMWSVAQLRKLCGVTA